VVRENSRSRRKCGTSVPPYRAYCFEPCPKPNQGQIAVAREHALIDCFEKKAKRVIIAIEPRGRKPVLRSPRKVNLGYGASGIRIKLEHVHRCLYREELCFCVIRACIPSWCLHLCGPIVPVRSEYRNRLQANALQTNDETCDSWLAWKSQP
jgi:hypothetical protein